MYIMTPVLKTSRRFFLGISSGTLFRMKLYIKVIKMEKVFEWDNFFRKHTDSREWASYRGTVEIRLFFIASKSIPGRRTAVFWWLYFMQGYRKNREQRNPLTTSPRKSNNPTSLSKRQNTHNKKYYRKGPCTLTHF